MARDQPQVNVRIPADLRDKLLTAMAVSGRSLTAEIVTRLEQSFLRPEPSVTDIAIQYMQAQQAYEARKGWVESARQAIKKQIARGAEPTEEQRKEFDEYEVELIYMRRALDVLKNRFRGHYLNPGDVEDLIREAGLEGERSPEG